MFGVKIVEGIRRIFCREKEPSPAENAIKRLNDSFATDRTSPEMVRAKTRGEFLRLNNEGANAEAELPPLEGFADTSYDPKEEGMEIPPQTQKVSRRVAQQAIGILNQPPAGDSHSPESQAQGLPHGPVATRDSQSPDRLQGRPVSPLDSYSPEGTRGPAPVGFEVDADTVLPEIRRDSTPPKGKVRR